MYTPSQARALLLPHIRQHEGDHIGLPFSDAAVDEIVEAFLAAADASTTARIATGVKAADAKMFEIQMRAKVLLSRVSGIAEVPLGIAITDRSVERRKAHLSKLRSVSPAYRRSQIPKHFRSKEEHEHADWQSTQAHHSHSPQASHPGDQGAAASLANAFGGTWYTSTIPNPYFPPAAHAGGLSLQQNVAYGQGMLQPLAGFQNAANGQMATLSNVFHSQQALQANLVWQEDEDLPTEIRPGEIIAWRAWMVRGHALGLQLHSMAAGAEWMPGQPMTGDIKRGLGVHAWKTKEQAQAYALRGAVIGQVELWGQVIEHEDGYRAEYGAIKSLQRSSNRSYVTMKQLQELQARYGVPVDKARRWSWLRSEAFGLGLSALIAVAAVLYGGNPLFVGAFVFFFTMLVLNLSTEK